jgi:hypothetical protein
MKMLNCVNGKPRLKPSVEMSLHSHRTEKPRMPLGRPSKKKTALRNLMIVVGELSGLVGPSFGRCMLHNCISPWFHMLLLT